EFLGGRPFRVEPVVLPDEASYPGLKPFVQREEVAKREAAATRAEEVLARSREFAAAAGRLLSAVEARWVPEIPRAFADPLNGVLAFPEGMPPPPELEQFRAALEAARLALYVDTAERDFALLDLAAIRARIVAD